MYQKRDERVLTMFITSIRLTRQRLVAAVVIAGVVLIALIVWIAGRGGAESRQTMALPSVKNIKTAEDRVGFLTACGWQISDDGAQSQEVLIPDSFDEVFDSYNDLQKTQGFDLSAYKNKRVMRYTYRVTNYPDGDPDVQATLLVYNNRIIGGDVCSTRLNGFMQGFMKT